jgi:fructan beta-fructosidase
VTHDYHQENLVPEAFRPAFHYSPARNWMNDPNGLVWYDGEYHLFYQHNPLGTDWGNMSWGHAVSADLLTWEELPVAIPFTDAEEVFSGSIVVDHANTSGLGSVDEPALVALYTSVATSTGLQAQSLAYSTDCGRTWSRFDGNPVLDVGSKDFRDPKVFWYDDGRYWVMVVMLAAERIVQFYRSDDLIEWAHLSDFGPLDSAAALWECPDLFKLPVEGEGPEETRWVLVVSVNPGAPAGGSGTRYFLGVFDGKCFTPDPDPGDDFNGRWFDYGADCYAPVSFSETPDGERVLIGWMNNWDYARRTPTSSFRGSMTLPRACRLRRLNGQIRLVQQPVGFADARRDHGLELRDVVVREGVTPLPAMAHGAALEITVEFAVGSAERFGLHVRAAGDQRTVVGYDSRSASLFVDRTASGMVDLHEGFPAVHHGPLAAEAGRVRLRIYVDAASVEVFGGHGECVITDQVFPAADSRMVSLFAEAGEVSLVYLDVTPTDLVSERSLEEGSAPA